MVLGGQAGRAAGGGEATTSFQLSTPGCHFATRIVLFEDDSSSVLLLFSQISRNTHEVA